MNLIEFHTPQGASIWLAVDAIQVIEPSSRRDVVTGEFVGFTHVTMKGGAMVFITESEGMVRHCLAAWVAAHGATA